MSEDYPPSFEDTLAELEALVDTLDQGDLPLDDSLRRFDHSLAMTRRCDEKSQKLGPPMAASDG